jgi:hypothetical protein
MASSVMPCAHVAQQHTRYSRTARKGHGRWKLKSKRKRKRQLAPPDSDATRRRRGLPVDCMPNVVSVRRHGPGGEAVTLRYVTGSVSGQRKGSASWRSLALHLTNVKRTCGKVSFLGWGLTFTLLSQPVCALPACGQAPIQVQVRARIILDDAMTTKLARPHAPHCTAPNCASPSASALRSLRCILNLHLHPRCNL